jgi:hypothetical protein
MGNLPVKAKLAKLVSVPRDAKTPWPPAFLSLLAVLPDMSTPNDQRTPIPCPLCGSPERNLPSHVETEHPDDETDLLDDLLDRARGET